MSDFKYVGSELDLFAVVHHWKAYWCSQIREYLRGDILEVGAGIGANTAHVDPGGDGCWVCLEPDPALTARLTENLQQAKNRRRYEAVCGTLQSLGDRQFDTIVYIDVLEHIERDSEELQTAAAHLRAGGHVIVLSPAHQRLYTPFDAAIGHFRRYNRATLRAAGPPNLRLRRLWYLDSAGLLASSANLIFLRQSMPTAAQLRFWDNWIIPVSRVLDKLLFYKAGKSIIAVWQK